MGDSIARESGQGFPPVLDGGDRPPLWISDAEAAELLPLGAAVDLLAEAHAAYAEGRATNMSRTHAQWGEAILHAVGGMVEGTAGTKTWMYTPRGAKPLLVLFAVEDGSVVGVVEAFGMGKVRTAATSGLATRLLASEDAGVLALLGTGKQALAQARVAAEVRPLREVRVFGREPARRAAFAERLAAELSVSISEHDAVESAIAGASLLTAVTRAQDPIVTGAMLKPGVHVNAVGAIVPSRRELDESAVARCSLVVTESRMQAEEDSGELRAAVEAQSLRWDEVAELGDLVTGARAGRTDAEEITLFKSLGVGLADVAIGIELLRRAADAGAGRELAREANRMMASALSSSPKEV
jgi:alanine dehydrogenase